VRDAGVTPEVHVEPDPDAVARAASAAIAACAADAIALRGRFALALTGGDTPRATYGALAARTDVDWRRCELFFGDERAVPPDHPDSNYRMVQETLLATPAAAAARLHRMPAEAADLDAAARDYERLLCALLGTPPRLDLVLLGLGTDGHVASLFPAHAALRERRRFVVATPAPSLAPRLTLTLAALDAARAVIFLVTGAHKAAIVRRVLYGAETPGEVPAQAVAARAGRVVWFVDRAAAPT
jgi:6-phosphogluconolactonase